MSVLIVRADSVTTRDLRRGWGTELDYLAPASGAQHVSVRLYRLEALGGQGPYHLHTDCESVYFVLAGVLAVRSGNDVSTLRKGDLAFIPPRVPHAVENVGDAEAVMLELYAPGAADFVPVDEPTAS